MKNNIIKKISTVLALLFIITLGFEISRAVWITQNKDEINKYLDEYETGTATYEDVRAVNLFLKDYVKIGETEKSDLVLSRSIWFFGATMMFGYKKVDRLGSGYVYKDKNNNTYSVIETNEWCPFFRVYSVSKGVI